MIDFIAALVIMVMAPLVPLIYFVAYKEIKHIRTQIRNHNKINS